MFCQVASLPIFGAGLHWDKGMNQKQYEDIKKSLLVAEHNLRTSRGYGLKYWMLHLREAEQLVQGALIQLEYAWKAAQPGDKRFD